MTTDVVSVGPNARVDEVGRILLERRISAVPVVTERGELVGIVSEGDLIRRSEAGTQHRRSWWLKLLMGQEGLAIDYIKANAVKVSDIMTRRVVTATPDMPLDQIAALLEKNRIKRVPVVRDGKVVGIVSRANLVQALASLRKKVATAQGPADSAVRDNVMARLKAEPWTHPLLLNVTVHDGVVDLWGVVNSETEKKAVRIAAEATPGVREVTDNLIVRPDIED